MGNVQITPVFIDGGTPRSTVPFAVTPYANIASTRLIGYLKCSTKTMRTAFGPGQPFPGQWVLTFSPPGEFAYVVNIYRSLQRDQHHDWKVTSTHWQDTWQAKANGAVVEGVTTRCQAYINEKIAAVAGAVFGDLSIASET